CSVAQMPCRNARNWICPDLRSQPGEDQDILRPAERHEIEPPDVIPCPIKVRPGGAKRPDRAMGGHVGFDEVNAIPLYRAAIPPLHAVIRLEVATYVHNHHREFQPL